MSRLGVQKCAKIFDAMQSLRIKLLGGDNHDILLGQMLEIGKDAMKERFCQLVTTLPLEDVQRPD